MKTISISTRLPIVTAARLLKHNETISISRAVRLIVEDFVKQLPTSEALSPEEALEYLFRRSNTSTPLAPTSAGEERELLNKALKELGVD